MKYRPHITRLSLEFLAIKDGADICYAKHYATDNSLDEIIDDFEALQEHEMRHSDADYEVRLMLNNQLLAVKYLNCTGYAHLLQKLAAAQHLTA